MNHKIYSLIASAWLASAGLALAGGDAAGPAQSTASAPGSAAQRKAEAKPKPVAPDKLVDINSAPANALKKLPGIDDALAVKIIAGRPYGSKAQLVSAGIIDAATYDRINRMLVARQPSKDAASKGALQSH